MTIKEEATLPVADGTTMPAYSARPVADYAPVGVIVAHELFGVNPDIRGVVDQLAADGFIAVAPELYHRDVAAGHWLRRDDGGRKEGFDLLHRMSRAAALADVRAAMDHLLAQPGIAEVAMVGFSAGGHLAYLAASRLPISRTVVLYGGWLPSTEIPISRPVPTLELTPGIRGRLMYLVGGDDALIGPDQRGQIEHALEAAGVDHEVITYAGVQHAYFWPGTPAFDESARDDSWRRILALLDDRVSAHQSDR